MSLSNGPSSISETRSLALLAILVGMSLCWLAVGDATHALRPGLLILGAASIFAAGWPLFVPRPADDPPWWKWGAAASVVGGLALGCALYLFG